MIGKLYWIIIGQEMVTADYTTNRQHKRSLCYQSVRAYIVCVLVF